MKISTLIIERIDSLLRKNSEDIYLHEPYFLETNALEYFKDCIDSGWVSSSGKWVSKFENAIAKQTGSKNVIAVSNGTNALRLSLFVLGVKPNEEVLIPPLSFVATANSVSHLGAYPHFIDIESKSLGMCPFALEKRLNQIALKKGDNVFNKHTGRRIAAVIPVHIFGLPADLFQIKKICTEWNLPIVEDAAEALGSKLYSSKQDFHCGCIGDLGILSFNGNKIITTGGGGAILTNNDQFAKLARHLSTTAKLDHQWEFIHDRVGWNDRLPNLNAALGVSQIEKLNERLRLKRLLHKKYIDIFYDIEELEIMQETNNSKSNYWLTTLRLLNENSEKLKEQILKRAHNSRIFLRPSWKLLSQLPMYNTCQAGDLKEALNQSKRLINLPSSPQLISKN